MVSIEKSPSPASGEAECEGSYGSRGEGASSSAVLMPMDPPGSPKADHEVAFMFNFFDELRRRLQAGK